MKIGIQRVGSAVVKSRQWVYLGWQGNNNFGDDLLHDTWKAALQVPLDIEASLFPRDYIKRAPAYAKDAVRLVGKERLLLLGGGTTIGFGVWADHIHRAMRRYGAKGVVIPGAGAAAASDSYALDLQAANWESWRSIPSMALFGVRGPLTKIEVERNLAEPVPVIGDPALMYPAVRRVEPHRESPRPVIGVCIGSQTGTRYDIGVVAASIKMAAAGLGPSDLWVFQLAESDRRVAEELSRALGGAPIRRYNGDVHRMMEFIGGCEIFISERLHGVVAAASLGVAVLPLSYASKCDDFWLSVSDEIPAIKPGHSVEELADEIVNSRDPEVVQQIGSRVGSMVDQLLDSAEVMGKWYRGSITVDEMIAGCGVGPGHGAGTGIRPVAKPEEADHA